MYWPPGRTGAAIRTLCHSQVGVSIQTRLTKRSSCSEYRRPAGGAHRNSRGQPAAGWSPVTLPGRDPPRHRDARRSCRAERHGRSRRLSTQGDRAQVLDTPCGTTSENRGATRLPLDRTWTWLISPPTDRCVRPAERMPGKPAICQAAAQTRSERVNAAMASDVIVATRRVSSIKARISGTSTMNPKSPLWSCVKLHISAPMRLNLVVMSFEL